MKPFARRSVRCWQLFSLLILLATLSIVPCCDGQVVSLIENTNAQGESFGIGDIEVVLPGAGFGVEITMGATAFSVSDLTLEYNGKTLPTAGFNVQILTFQN